MALEFHSWNVLAKKCQNYIHKDVGWTNKDTVAIIMCTLEPGRNLTTVRGSFTYTLYREPSHNSFNSTIVLMYVTRRLQ